MTLKTNTIKKILLSTFVLIGLQSYSQKDSELVVKESFESENSIVNYKKSHDSNLSISKKHRMFGQSSLQWEWSGKSFFGTSGFSSLSEDDSPLKYGDHFPNSPVLSLSIYNEIAQDEIIKISYEKEEVEQVWFNIKLNFTGWRTIWVPFYEMNGNPPKKNEDVSYDYFKVSSNSENGKGKLFFDDIVFSQYQDDRHSYPDMIVPFIKRDLIVGVDHWMPLIRDLKRTQAMGVNSISDAQKQDLAIIEKRIDNNFKSDSKKKDFLAQAQKEFSKLKLINGKTVLGPPLTFKIEQVYFPVNDLNKKNFTEVSVFGVVLKKLAGYYLKSNGENKAKIEAMFITSSKYFLDQGWQEGSSGGTRHHIGYNVRDLTDAFYMMKQPLKKAGLLNEVGRSLQWIFNLGKILGNEEEFNANIDYFNTQSFYHLMLIFMSDSPEKQAALLKAYSRYISITLAQDTGIGVFKIDGTSWHHGGHYPAYGLGAFRSIPPVIHTLSGTDFRIETAGHKNFKKSLLTSRLYSNLLDFGFGNAGRHPFEDNSIKSLQKSYLHMAYSGNPEHTSDLDNDFASAYLRMWGKSDKTNSKVFKEKHQLKPEKLPGYHVMPYGATSIHRRNNWAAIIKGYSKYVWASEIYVASNRYGRYPANGTIQLLNKKGEIGSGFDQKGWDWNRYPGATVVYLPFNELEPDTPLLMFRSEETFAGAVQLGENGVFGMKLNESKGSNAEGSIKNSGFPGKLKANKSVFSFGDKLICIGTGISSIDSKNPVQTNLFQNRLVETGRPIFSSVKKNINEFPYNAVIDAKENNKTWLIDAYQNGYHILSSNKVEISRKHQKSYHNKYSIKTGKMNKKAKGVTNTEGNFASSWLDHGTAPKNASYKYVIYPGLKKKELNTFGKKLRKDKSYQILRADNIAHIVRDGKTSTTGYVIFKEGKELGSELLKSVSDPSLLMIKDNGTKITISAVQPDLNFLDVVDKTHRGYSQSVDLTITLIGEWRLESNSKVKSISIVKGNTVIILECQHGFSNKFEVIKN